MLVVRADQMKVFSQTARQRFEDEMVAHSRDFSPRLCEVLGEEQLRVALRSAMQKAEGYGFTNRGPVRLYIEMMFLCGSAFDTDPQYTAVGDALRASGDQMERAEEIHQASLDYLEKVSGPQNANVRRAMTDLLGMAQRPLNFPGGFVEGMLGEMTWIFPQKVAYIGDAPLKVLIEEGLDKAGDYQFTATRQSALLVTLMFALGHGCTNDPLYPWIARTLEDERITDPAARAERLESKAMRWLEHVLGRKPEGTQT